jgi:hypothetical protein
MRRRSPERGRGSSDELAGCGAVGAGVGDVAAGGSVAGGGVVDTGDVTGAVAGGGVVAVGAGAATGAVTTGVSNGGVTETGAVSAGGADDGGGVVPAPTVTTLVAVWSPAVAVMVTTPSRIPRTSPFPVTIAMVLSLVVHFTSVSRTPTNLRPLSSTNFVVSLSDSPT